MKQKAIEFPESTPIRHMVYQILCDGGWYMPHELVRFISSRWNILVSDATVTAKLRDLRKSKYGAHAIEKRQREGSKAYEYRMENAGQQDFVSSTPMVQGRKMSKRKIPYVKRYNLSNRMARKMRDSFLDQLDKCADESARRVLLGIGRPRKGLSVTRSGESAGSAYEGR